MVTHLFHPLSHLYHNRIVASFYRHDSRILNPSYLVHLRRLPSVAFQSVNGMCVAREGARGFPSFKAEWQ